jgi:Rho-binding antiterminator
MENYTPVNCDFYDELEALATLKKDCEIKFKGDNDGISSIKGKIADLYTHEHIEYMKTDTGLEIRLDKLVEVDGKRPEQYC